MDALNRQQAITDTAQKKHRDVIMGAFQSKHSLAYMITLICVALAHVSVVLAAIISMIITQSVSVLGIAWLLVYMAFVVAPLRAMIAAIRLYFDKKEDTFRSKTKELNALSSFWVKAFQIILGIIVLALFIFLVLAVIILLYVNVIANKTNADGSSFGGIGIGSGTTFLSLLVGDWLTGIILLVILPLVVGGGLIVLCSKCTETYNKIKNYVKQMAETHVGNTEYFQLKITDSSLRFYILGAIFALLGIGTMIWGNELIGGLSPFGVFFITNGVCIIINGIFFKHADEDVQTSVLEYTSERAILDDLHKRSLVQQAEYLRKKRRENAVLRKKENEEEKLPKEM